MITKKQVKKLKEKISNGEFPSIPKEFHWLLSDIGCGRKCEFYSWLPKGAINYFLKQMIYLGLINQAHNLTRLGTFYYNGRWFDLHYKDW